MLLAAALSTLLNSLGRDALAYFRIFWASTVVFEESEHMGGGKMPHRSPHIAIGR